VSEPLHDEAEVIDGLPVLGDEPPPPGAQAPAPVASRALTLTLTSPAQAAAVAVGSFVAGAAAVGLVHRRQTKRRALSAGRPPRRLSRRGERGARGAVGELVQVVASRSFLVDVHLLGSPGPQR
jgi:hypothetical protein